jgi:hypothetical protein
MPTGGFQTHNPSKRAALDRAVTGIGSEMTFPLELKTYRDRRQPAKGRSTENERA